MGDFIFAAIGDIYDKPLAGAYSVLKARGVSAVVTSGFIEKQARSVRLLPFDFARGEDFAAAVTAAHAQPAEDIVFAEVGGYRFILDNERSGLREETRRKFLDPRVAELKGRRPFFFVQRFHPAGTCAGDYTPGQDGGVSTEFLSAFPNAVALAEGGHLPLTDDRAVKQGDFGFTAVQLSSYRAPSLLGGRENALAGARRADDRVPERQMPPLDPATKRWRPALIVRVTEAEIVFSRISLLTGESLGADWTMPLDAYGTLSYTNQAARRPLPTFAPGAQVKIACGRGRTTRGAETDQVTVSWPQTATPRPLDYSVRVLCAEGGVEMVVAEKRVYSPGIFGPASAEPPRATCVFAQSELFTGIRLRFEVRAVDAFGRESAALAGFATVGERAKRRG